MSMSIGRAVKVALVQRGKSVIWLSDQLGVSRTRASNIANSESITTRTLVELAEIFSIKPSELIALGEFEESENAE